MSPGSIFGPTPFPCFPFSLGIQLVGGVKGFLEALPIIVFAFACQQAFFPLYDDITRRVRKSVLFTLRHEEAGVHSYSH